MKYGDSTPYIYEFLWRGASHRTVDFSRITLLVASQILSIYAWLGNQLWCMDLPAELFWEIMDICIASLGIQKRNMRLHVCMQKRLWAQCDMNIHIFFFQISLLPMMDEIVAKMQPKILHNMLPILCQTVFWVLNSSSACNIVLSYLCWPWEFMLGWLQLQDTWTDLLFILGV